ncbi:MAG: acyl-CoA dehydrogenase family protein, partial [Brevundimonas sp.]|uniref:acyl-CoA dehydrogenase family protein n=1 Tax=Brevundimonas sp. TaxID=1871086 RepID=UPI002735697C
MHVEFTPDQQALRAEFRAYLDGLMTPEVRAATVNAESGPVYRRIIRQMGTDGWLTPGWPVEYGGRGLDPLTQKILLEELVLAEAPFPFVTVNTVGPALMRLGTEKQKRDILPRIASGELVATLAVDEGPRHDPSAIAATVDGGKLTGTKAFVAEGDSAGLFVVAATDGLYLVEAGQGVSVSRRHLVDFRSHAQVTFDGAPADKLASGGADLLDAVLDRAAVLTAAEMLGMAGQAFDTTLAYLKQRVQFGQILATFQALQDESPHGGQFQPAEYADLFEAIFAAGEVREAVQAHPRIMILGTLEARVQGADLVIMGGLNDGVWPKTPDPDPWLNRKMRKEAGLLLPERQIGLAAHDFQQAIAAPRVVLSRAARDAEAQTVPSRWLNRLENLMAGLPGRNGPEALAAMKARGQDWVQLAQALDRPSAALLADPRFQPAKRPAPRPPVAARPDRLSLTEITKLIRDPFAIYARHVLRLKPLDPLRAAPDPRDRGSILHDILERFVRQRPAEESREAARARLLSTAAEVLATGTPFPAARLLWLARLERAAEHFLTQ